VCLTCGAALGNDPAAAYPHALRPGTQLQQGAYSVGRVLGQGGFGITYQGGDMRANRSVAIKELFLQGSTRRGLTVHPPVAVSVAEYNQTRAKFLEEAGVLARFHDPGIVEVYAAFEEHNTVYMVMEFLRGRSLMKLVEERGPIPQHEAIDYIVSTCRALQRVHDVSMLHRDIKPDNIMLTDDGRVVLIDFGNARTFAAGMTRRMTTMVTPGYTPLEQYGQQVRFGPYTDIYALGATLYHLLTGEMPPSATDRATGDDLRPPHEANPAVSPEVSEAVMWAMEMRIDERPQTIADFLTALNQAKQAIRPVTRKPAPLPPPDLEPDLPVPSPLPDRGPFYIQVSGDNVRWPDHCACCFEPADSYFAAEHTGGEGPFFLFPETRGWDVPYCSQCLRHLELAIAPDGGVSIAGPLASMALGGPVGCLFGLGAAALGITLASQRRSTLGPRHALLWFPQPPVCRGISRREPLPNGGVRFRRDSLLHLRDPDVRVALDPGLFHRVAQPLVSHKRPGSFH
jgi:serine/threonine protein kinase